MSYVRILKESQTSLEILKPHSQNEQWYTLCKRIPNLALSKKLKKITN